MEEQGWAVTRALASHQCVPSLIPGVHVICGMSLLGFSLGTPVSLFPQKQVFNLILFDLS